MTTNTININEVLICDHFNTKNERNLYFYALASYITAGRGYISYRDLINEMSLITGKSHRTCKRWVEQLIQSDKVKYRKGIVHLVGQRRLFVSDESTTYIKYNKENLISYVEFRNHTIRQIAYLIQRRFKIAFRNPRVLEHATSLFKKGEIETEFALLKNANEAGCSLSKIVEKLGVDKAVASKALKGYTKKQYRHGKWVRGSAMRTKFKPIMDFINSKNTYKYGSGNSYKWSYKYNKSNDTYRISYQLSSKIVVKPCLSKKKVACGLTRTVEYT